MARSATIVAVSTGLAFAMAAGWVWNPRPAIAWLALASMLLYWSSLGRGTASASIIYTTTFAIAFAFHWSPQAMAYAMASSWWLGLALSVPIMLLDSLRLAAGFLLARWITNGPLAFGAVAGIGAIVSESYSTSCFPWRLGYVQWTSPHVLQLSSVLGPGWATAALFLHALAGVAIFLAVRRSAKSLRSGAMKGLRPAVIAIALTATVVACDLWGWYRIAALTRSATQQPRLRLLALQVDPSYNDAAGKLRSMSRKERREVDLVCWPESAGGNYSSELEKLDNRKEVYRLSRAPARGLQPWPEATAPLLLGGKTFWGSVDEPQRCMVSAMLIDCDQRIIQRYHKRHLMPFGEYIPAESLLETFGNLFDLSDTITPGTEPTVLGLPNGMRIGAMLCFEDMVPEAARSLADNGAEALVSLINGSSFDDSLTLRQHRVLAQMRSIENARPLIRCSATGESCIIDACGRITASIPMQTEGSMYAAVSIYSHRTLYTRTGDWFAPACVAALAGIVVARRRRLLGEKHR